MDSCSVTLISVRQPGMGDSWYEFAAALVLGNGVTCVLVAVLLLLLCDRCFCATDRHPPVPQRPRRAQGFFADFWEGLRPDDVVVPQ